MSDDISGQVKDLQGRIHEEENTTLDNDEIPDWDKVSLFNISIAYQAGHVSGCLNSKRVLPPHRLLCTVPALHGLLIALIHHQAACNIGCKF